MNSIKHDKGAHADAAAFVTVEEYFEAEAERHGGRKSEYIDGRIRPMTEMGVRHIRIHSNLVGLLIVALRGHPFNVLGPETPLRVSGEGPYCYPEIIVMPRSLESHHDGGDSPLDPVSVFEITFPSTAPNDRDEKSKNYSRIDSLRDYVLVAQDRIEIDHFWRDADDGWHWANLQDASGALSLKGVDISLSLAKIFDRVSFESPGQTGNSE